MSGGNQYRAGHPEPVSCAVDFCPDPAKQSGWCHKHYGRWRRHGDPLHEVQRRQRLPERELIRLRRMVGLGDEGPTAVDMRRWKRDEYDETEEI
jgi:hypothetical protein